MEVANPGKSEIGLRPCMMVTANIAHLAPHNGHLLPHVMGT